MDSHFFFNLQNKEKVNTIPGLEGASTRDQQQQPHLRRYNKLAETVFDRLQFNFKFLQKQKGHGRVVWLRISRRGRIVTNEFLNFPPQKNDRQVRAKNAKEEDRGAGKCFQDCSC